MAEWCDTTGRSIIELTKVVVELTVGYVALKGAIKLAALFDSLVIAMTAAEGATIALNTAMKTNLALLAGWASYKVGSFIQEYLPGGEAEMLREVNEAFERNIRLQEEFMKMDYSAFLKEFKSGELLKVIPHLEERVNHYHKQLKKVTGRSWDPYKAHDKAFSTAKLEKYTALLEKFKKVQADVIAQKKAEADADMDAAIEAEIVQKYLEEQNILTEKKIKLNKILREVNLPRQLKEIQVALDDAFAKENGFENMEAWEKYLKFLEEVEKKVKAFDNRKMSEEADAWDLIFKDYEKIPEKTEDVADETKTIWELASESMGQSMSSLFIDAAKDDLDGFSEYFKIFAEGLAATWAAKAAEMSSQKITTSLTDSMGAGLAGLFGDIGGGIVGAGVSFGLGKLISGLTDAFGGDSGPSFGEIMQDLIGELKKNTASLEKQLQPGYIEHGYEDKIDDAIENLSKNLWHVRVAMQKYLGFSKGEARDIINADASHGADYFPQFKDHEDSRLADMFTVWEKTMKYFDTQIAVIFKDIENNMNDFTGGILNNSTEFERTVKDTEEELDKYYAALKDLPGGLQEMPEFDSIRQSVMAAINESFADQRLSVITEAAEYLTELTDTSSDLAAAIKSMNSQFDEWEAQILDLGGAENALAAERAAAQQAIIDNIYEDFSSSLADKIFNLDPDVSDSEREKSSIMKEYESMMQYIFDNFPAIIFPEKYASMINAAQTWLNLSLSAAEESSTAAAEQEAAAEAQRKAADEASRNNVLNAISDALSETSELDQAVRSINETWDKNRQTLEELGVSSEDLQRLEAARVAALKDEAKAFQALANDPLMRASGTMTDWISLNIDGMSEIALAAEKLKDVSSITSEELSGLSEKITDVYQAQFEAYVQQWEELEAFKTSLADDRKNIKSDMSGPRSLSDIQNAIAGLAGMNTEEMLIQAEDIRQSIMDRYDLEKSAIDDITSSINEMQDAVDAINNKIRELKYSQYNLALPGVKQETAAQDYKELLKAAKGGDAGSINDYLGFIDTYLEQSMGMYKSSSAYTNIFDSVNRDLESLGLSAADAVSEQERLLGSIEQSGLETIALLDDLSTIAENQQAAIETQITTLSGLLSDGGPVVTAVNKVTKAIVEEIGGLKITLETENSKPQAPIQLSLSVPIDGVVNQTIETIIERKEHGEKI